MASTDLSFPIIDRSTFEGLERTHKLVQIVPFDEATLAYSLVLPAPWVIQDDLGEQAIGIGHLAQIGLFREQVESDGALVQVSLTSMPFEIGLRDWLYYEAERNGVRVVTDHRHEMNSGPGIEIGGLYGPDNAPFVARLLGHIDNARIFVIMGTVTSPRYPATQRDLAIATNTFQLLNPTNLFVLEDRLEVEVKAGNPKFCVDYPASWSPRIVDKFLPGKTGLDLLLPGEDQVLAYLRIKAIAPSAGGYGPTAKVLEDAEKELEDAAARITTPWSEDSDLSLREIEDIEGIYQALGTLSGTQVEFRMGIAKRKSLRFAVTLISERRENNPLLWMRSKRAYEIALATCRSLSS